MVRLQWIHCSLALCLLVAVSSVAAASVESVVKELVHGSSPLPGDAEFDPLKPIPLMAMSEYRLSFLEVATGHEARKPLVCGENQVCPYEGGVCCASTGFCCAEACHPDGRRCMMNPMERALRVAELKMRLEAQTQINSEQGEKKHSEQGTKRVTEQAEKATNEGKAKQAAAAAQTAAMEQTTKTEEALKKEKAVAENLEKQRKVAAEKERAEAAKAKAEAEIADAQAKAASEKARLDAIHAANVDRQEHLIRGDNFRPEKNTVCAPADKLKDTGSYTYTMWIHPQSVQDKLANILKHGSSETEVNPGIYVLPSKSTFKLEVKSSTATDPNASANPPGGLAFHRWTFVAVQHNTDGEMRVWINGQVAITSNVGAGPKFVAGNLWCGDLKSATPGVVLADLRYYDSYLVDDKILGIFKERHFKPVTSDGKILANNAGYVPGRNKIRAPASQVAPHAAYTYTFWIKPLKQDQPGSWATVFQRGNNANEYVPGVWMKGGSTVLHVRSQTLTSENQGVDSTQSLAVNKWTHVAVVHGQGRMDLYFNGKRVAQSHPAAVKIIAKAPLWDHINNTGYEPAQAQLSDLRYFGGLLTEKDIVRVMNENQHPAE